MWCVSHWMWILDRLILCWWNKSDTWYIIPVDYRIPVGMSSVFSNWYPYPYWKLALPYSCNGRVWTLVWAWDFYSYHSGTSNFCTLQYLCPTLNLCLHSGYKHCLNPKPKMVIPVCKTGIFSYYFRISHIGPRHKCYYGMDTPHFPHQIIDYVTKWPPSTWVAITNLFSPSMILLVFQIFAKKIACVALEY
jgi:hypothetical protein